MLQCEADCLPPFNVEFKNVWSYSSMPPYYFMVCTGTTYNILPILIILASHISGLGSLVRNL